MPRSLLEHGARSAVCMMPSLLELALVASSTASGVETSVVWLPLNAEVQQADCPRMLGFAFKIWVWVQVADELVVP